MRTIRTKTREDGMRTTTRTTGCGEDDMMITTAQEDTKQMVEYHEVKFGSALLLLVLLRDIPTLMLMLTPCDEKLSQAFSSPRPYSYHSPL